MNSMIVAAIMAVQILAMPGAKATPEVTYFEVARQAIFNCPAYQDDIVKVKPTLVFDLIGIERKYGVPSELRGILLATACNNKALSGDIKPLRYWIQEKKPIAKINFKSENFSRFFYQKTADILMTRIVERMPQVEKKCGKMSEVDKWKAAWEEGSGCHKKPKGFKLLRNWHTEIIKQKLTKKKKQEYTCDC